MIQTGEMSDERVPGRPSRGAQAAMLLLLLVVCFGVEASAALVTQPAVEGWYQGIAKPGWTPPDMAFPIVWTLLYLMMALAAWLAWRAAPRAASGALWPFFIQLALNASWSYAFFGFAQIALGFVILLALVLAVLATMTAFAQRSATAAWLLVPYLLWIGYAAVLNGAILGLNA